MKASFFKLLALVAAVASPFVLAAAECTDQPGTEQLSCRVPSLKSIAARVAAQPAAQVIAWTPQLEGQRARVLAMYRQINPAQVLASGQTVWQALGCGSILQRSCVDVADILAAHPNFEVTGIENSLFSQASFRDYEQQQLERCVQLCCDTRYARALTPNVCLALLPKMLQRSCAPFQRSPAVPIAQWQQFLQRVLQAPQFQNARPEIGSYLIGARTASGPNVWYAAVAGMLSPDHGNDSLFVKSKRWLWQARMANFIQHNCWQEVLNQYDPSLDVDGMVCDTLVNTFIFALEKDKECVVRAQKSDWRERIFTRGLGAFGILAKIKESAEPQAQWLTYNIVDRIYGRLEDSVLDCLAAPDNASRQSAIERCQKFACVLNDGFNITGTHPQYGALLSFVCDQAHVSALQHCGVASNFKLFFDILSGAVEASQGNGQRKKLINKIREVFPICLKRWLGTRGAENSAEYPAECARAKALTDWCITHGVLPHYFASIQNGQAAGEGSVLADYHAYVQEKVRAYERQHACHWMSSAVTHAIYALRGRAAYTAQRAMRVGAQCNRSSMRFVERHNKIFGSIFAGVGATIAVLTPYLTLKLAPHFFARVKADAFIPGWTLAGCFVGVAAALLQD